MFDGYLLVQALQAGLHSSYWASYDWLQPSWSKDCWWIHQLQGMLSFWWRFTCYDFVVVSVTKLKTSAK